MVRLQATMNFMANSGYTQGAPVNGQFVEHNLANLDYHLIHEGSNRNVSHTRSTNPNTNIISNAVKTEVKNTNSLNISGSGSVPIENESSTGDGIGLVTKSQPFPFHDPFDIESYPITNPPIFDSTMMLPYTTNEGVPRRRRISISNGQIGQIVNHEFLLDDESLLDNQLYSGRLVRLSLNSRNENRPGDIQNGVLFDQIQRHNQLHLANPQPQPRLQEQAQTLSDKTVQIPQKFNIQARQHNFPVEQSSIDLSTKQPLPIEPTAAGVPPPNHQLIYNNEVIYNPNDGPIPGTAAWKKERLLERNRVAAFKCRQRKKHAQKQLQDDISKFQNEIDTLKDKLGKYEALFKDYSLIISKHADKCSDPELRTLMKFSDIESLSNDDVDTIHKIAHS